MVATYIGVALYIILFFGYMIYERFVQGKTTHFVPITEVDLKSDTVWEPGQGDGIRAQDQRDAEKESSMKLAFTKVMKFWFYELTWPWPDLDGLSFSDKNLLGVFLFGFTYNCFKVNIYIVYIRNGLITELEELVSSRENLYFLLLEITNPGEHHYHYTTERNWFICK